MVCVKLCEFSSSQFKGLSNCSNMCCCYLCTGEPSTGVVSAAGHTVPRPMQHVQPVPLHVDVESVTEQPEVEPAVSHVLPLQAHAEEDHGSQPQLGS